MKVSPIRIEIRKKYSVKERITAWIKYLRCMIVRGLLKSLWLCPVNKSKVVFMSFNGKQYSDSPKYIYEYLKKESIHMRYVWVMNKIEEGSCNDWGDICVRNNSFKSFFHILTCGFLVTNNHIPSYIPKRKTQVFLNTWHGGSPLKTVGFAESVVCLYDYYFFYMQEKMYTAFLSSSKFMSNDVFYESFGYKGLILPYGMPRNAILLSEHEDIVSRVYNYFNLLRGPNTGIILYAPTFRGSFQEGSFLPPEQQLDIERVLDNLKKTTGIKYYFLFRAHHTMTSSVNSKNVVIATEYPDMQELLCAADILVTDYSSCMGDMALMKKPVLLYAPDLESYVKSRGFYWDIYSLPFPIAKSNDDFINKIKTFDICNYRDNVQGYLDRLGCYETSESIEKTVEWILKQNSREKI